MDVFLQELSTLFYNNQLNNSRITFYHSGNNSINYLFHAVLPYHAQDEHTENALNHQIVSSMMPTEKFNSVKKKKCSVCLEDFSPNDKIKRLPCLHTFHCNCINKWLQIKLKCPECNFDIQKFIMNY